MRSGIELISVEELLVESGMEGALVARRQANCIIASGVQTTGASKAIFRIATRAWFVAPVCAFMLCIDESRFLEPSWRATTAAACGIEPQAISQAS